MRWCPEAIVQRCFGKYEIQPEFVLAVTHKGQQLFMQATGQQRFEVFPKSTTESYLKVVDAQIVFNVNDGQVESQTLHQAGRKIAGKKIK